MELKDKIIVVTGAASGIGRAMCLRFAEEGAAHIACVDRDLKGAEETARMMGGTAHQVDVAVKDQITAMIDKVEQVGPIDLFSQTQEFPWRGVSRCPMTTGSGSGKSM